MLKEMLAKSSKINILNLCTFLLLCIAKDCLRGIDYFFTKIDF